MSTTMPNITFALTSTFTPPSSCLSPTNTLSPLSSDLPSYTSSPAGSDIQTVSDFGISGGDWYAVTKGSTSDCFPSNFFPTGTTTVSSGTTYSVESFFSPGACPSGYVTVQTEILSTDIATTCCPSLYSLGSTSVGAPLCEMYGWAAWVIDDGSGDTETVTGRGQFATPVVYRFRQDDASLFTTSSSSTTSATSGPTATPSATATMSTTASSSATPSATVAPVDNGLSTGAQAGIGIGVALGVLAAVLVAFSFWRRHRSHQVVQSADVPPVYAEEKRGPTGDYSQSHELGNGRDIAEIDGSAPVAELDGSWRGWEAGDGARGRFQPVPHSAPSD